MYSNPITIHRGVDNKIQFRFLNQEQKPVNISGKEITCRIISYDGKSTLLQKALVELLPLTGLATLNLTTEEVQMFHSQRCHYSLEIADGEFDFPVFVDQTGGGRGVLEIIDSIIPPFVDSRSISIPSHPAPAPWAPVTYYSSVYAAKDDSALTFQISLDDFSGIVTIEGSTTQGTDWYTIQALPAYTNETSNIGATIAGYHPFIRVKFSESYSGAVTRILIR